jgi:hypothetical protein
MCFHYDPSTGKYSAAIITLVRVGGVLTMLALVGFWLVVARRGRREARQPVTG